MSDQETKPESVSELTNKINELLKVSSTMPKQILNVRNFRDPEFQNKSTPNHRSDASKLSRKSPGKSGKKEIETQEVTIPVMLEPKPCNPKFAIPPLKTLPTAAYQPRPPFMPEEHAFMQFASSPKTRKELKEQEMMEKKQLEEAFKKLDTPLDTEKTIRAIEDDLQRMIAEDNSRQAREAQELAQRRARYARSSSEKTTSSFKKTMASLTSAFEVIKTPSDKFGQSKSLSVESQVSLLDKELSSSLPSTIFNVSSESSPSVSSHRSSPADTRCFMGEPEL